MSAHIPRSRLITAVAIGMLVAVLQTPAAGSSLVAPPEPRAASESTRSQAPGAVSRSVGNLPLYFVENRGQMDSRVAYYVQGRDADVYFTSRGLTFSLAGPPDERTAAGDPTGSAASRPRHVLKLDFVGADPNVRPVGRDRTPAVFSYFSGSRDARAQGLRSYTSVVYRDLWAGIDLVYSGTGNRLKYTFVLEPGADPDQIRLAYRGGTGARVKHTGELEIDTSVGRFRDDEPSAYQEMGGRRVDVATRYHLGRRGGPGSSTYEYGFRLGAYDHRRPLVLDPAFLVYAGFIGGAGDERGLGIAVDGVGNSYVVGQTTSSEATFPRRVGPQIFYAGNLDGYVAKVNASGTSLVYAGYIGGSGNDAAFDVTVDGAGNAYVTGFTTSSQSTFPVEVGPDLTFNGNEDSFVAKVNPSGTALVYAGYIGGRGTDFGEGIAVDAAGNAYVSGTTGSNQQTFPETRGPDLTYNGGRFDTYVAKVNAAGTGLEYAGYVGGSGNDVPVSNGRDTTVSGGHIALDAAGNAYLSGTTSSGHNTFPDGNGFDALPGPDRTFNGKTDAFVAKVRADGVGLVYAGYIGGSGADRGFGMAVDSGGNAYLTGDTDSTQATFPVTVGPDLTFNGVTDTFVAKVRENGSGLVYAGYLGGADGDQGLGVAIQETVGGTFLYVVGHTHSSDATYPVKVGPDLTYNGAGENGDAFIAKIAPSPSSATVTDNLVYSGYIGGAGEDAAFWVDVDADGNAYVTGDTDSTGATFPDGDGFGPEPSTDRTSNGGVDAFVVRVSEQQPARPLNDDLADAISFTSLPFTDGRSTAFSTSEPGEPAPCGDISRTIWYAFTPTVDTAIAASTEGSDFDTVLAAYTGTSLSDLSLLACNDQGGSANDSRITAIAPGGTTTYFQVGGFAGDAGSLSFTVSRAPLNDSFAGATEVGSLPFTDELSTVDATTEADEPAPCGLVAKTVWYSFTPSTDVTITADTYGSDFDTILAAYTGSSLADLTNIACGDQYGGTVQSQISFVAPAGTRIFFQAGSLFGDSGHLVLNLAETTTTPPANDRFANAAAIPSRPFTASLSTTTATSEVGEPIACGGIAHTVWYKFTPSSDTTITADTFGSSFDTVLAAYTGSSLTSLTALACNDQAAGGNQSQISFAASAGTTIYFQVGGFFGDTGDLKLNLP